VSYKKVDKDYLRRDTGCEFAPSCFNCPFEVCVYEYPGGKKAWLKKERNKSIKELRQKGKSTKELAEMFKVGVRAIQRVLKGE